MKKIIIIMLFLICLPVLKPLYSAKDEWTPGKLVIAGGIVAGVELIYIIVNLFISERNKEEDIYADATDGTNVMKSKELEELEKFELLEQLICRSKLFDIIEGKKEKTEQEQEREREEEEELNLLMAKIMDRKPRRRAKGLLTGDDEENKPTRVEPKEEVLVEKITNDVSIDSNVKDITKSLDIQTKETNVKGREPDAKTKETNVKLKDSYAITPFEAQFEFHYKITNQTTGEVFTKSKIDYYQIGKAYYSVDRKERAKRYFLRTIADDHDRINRAKAVIFLQKNYDMPLDIMIKEVQRYRKEKEK